VQKQHVTLDGDDIAYFKEGQGPALLLVHGMAGSSDTWAPVIPALAKRFTVIAPDLIGHGDSARGRADYSLGGFATGLRDLLIWLGVERVTVIGQSLGGGIAMQFANQFPDRCERMVLVGSGGFGREVNGIMRLLSLPGGGVLLAAGCREIVVDVVEDLAPRFARLGVHPGAQLREIGRSYASLTDALSRWAFLRTLRSVVDVHGQVMDALGRLYLAAELPTLIVWGDADPIIPVAHARAAHDHIKGSRLEIFPGVGHYPHCEAPERFVEVLEDFIAHTPAAVLTAAGRRKQLKLAVG